MTFTIQVRLISSLVTYSTHFFLDSIPLLYHIEFYKIKRIKGKEVQRIQVENFRREGTTRRNVVWILNFTRGKRQRDDTIQ